MSPSQNEFNSETQSELEPRFQKEPMTETHPPAVSRLSETGSKPHKSAGKKKIGKGKLNTCRSRMNESKNKNSKTKEMKSVSSVKNVDSEQKENRPLQVNSMSGNRISRFYKTQRKIQIEEEIIEELQSKT